MVKSIIVLAALILLYLAMRFISSIILQGSDIMGCDCKTCSDGMIGGPLACQVCNQGDFMTKREIYSKKLNETHRQETRQKFAMELLAQAEMFSSGVISPEKYMEKTRGVLVAMREEIREKTRG